MKDRPERPLRRRCLKAAALGLVAFVPGFAAGATPGACPKSTNRSRPVVRLHTNYGVITLELDAEKAPQTVANFLEYVNSGFYNGTVFHRVIDGFMIQGGGFEPGMKQKKTRDPIPNEAKNGLKNARGTIAMARTSDPHSATAQFFINVADNANLDYPSFDGWGYAVFGRVSEGMDVVDKIKAVATGSGGFHRDVPKQDVVIERAEAC